MKSIFRFIMTILTTLMLCNIYTSNLKTKACSFDNIDSDSKALKENNNPVTHIQSKAQVEFFKDALDKLGATSPDEVVKIWTEAERTRNGVFHYAVACSELKNKLST